MKNANNRNERQLRRELARQSCLLRKSRIRTPNFDNQGGYMIVDAHHNFVKRGSRFELSLEDVEDYLNE